MPYTYSGDPSSSDRDELRFLLQDTANPGFMTDAELDYLLTQYPTVPQAALAAARTLYAKFAQQVSKSVGDLRIEAGARAANWAAMITTLQDLIATQEPGGIYAGGQSRDEQTTDDADTNLPHGSFRLGMHDLPDAPSDDWLTNYPELS